MSMCFLRGRPPAGVVSHQQVPPASFHLQGKDGDSGHLSRWSPSDDKQMTVLTSECRHTHSPSGAVRPIHRWEMCCSNIFLSWESGHKTGGCHRRKSPVHVKMGETPGCPPKKLSPSSHHSPLLRPQ